MTTDTVGAYQEICQRVRDVNASQAVTTLVGYTPEIRYANVSYKDMQSVDNKYWLRVTMVGAGQRKRTLGAPSRVTYQGLADIQLFMPIKAARAAEVGLKLAEILKSAFLSNTANVDFFQAMIKDMPDESQWFYKRVNATYNYDTLE